MGAVEARGLIVRLDRRRSGFKTRFATTTTCCRMICAACTQSIWCFRLTFANARYRLTALIAKIGPRAERELPKYVDIARRFGVPMQVVNGYYVFR